MIKVMSLMKRKEGMAFADFRKWLLDEHVAFARNLPGLRKYTANSLLKENPDAPYDGITELFFDSEQAMADAFGTDAGKAARRGCRGALLQPLPHGLRGEAAVLGAAAG